MSSCAVILAEGFEEIEALTPVDLLRRAKLGCDLIALGEKKGVVGSHGIRVKADGVFDETDFSRYDGLILPGGMAGTKRLLADERLASLLRRFATDGKLTAAICAAPTVLGRCGLLEGRRAVCYPGLEAELSGAIVCSAPAVRDGTVVTGRGMGASVPFALALVEYFTDKATADALAAKIVYSE